MPLTRAHAVFTSQISNGDSFLFLLSHEQNNNCMLAARHTTTTKNIAFFFTTHLYHANERPWIGSLDHIRNGTFALAVWHDAAQHTLTKRTQSRIPFGFFLLLFVCANSTIWAEQLTIPRGMKMCVSCTKEITFKSKHSECRFCVRFSSSFLLFSNFKQSIKTKTKKE